MKLIPITTTSASMIPQKLASIRQPRPGGGVHQQHVPDVIDVHGRSRTTAANDPSMLVMNTNSHKIAKFPNDVGEANELLMKQLVTVKFSFNNGPAKTSSDRDESEVAFDQGNYDELPLILPQYLTGNIPFIDVGDPPANDLKRTISNLGEKNVQIPEKFDKSVQILYQKYEARSLTHRNNRTHRQAIVHRFAAETGLGKVCQVCHTTLKPHTSLKCLQCDFKCHIYCQNDAVSEYQTIILDSQ